MGMVIPLRNYAWIYSNLVQSGKKKILIKLSFLYKTQKDREKKGSDLKILPEKILPTSQIILYLFNKILIGSQRKFIYSHFFSS